MPSAAPLSIWDLFQNADLIVKLVMVGLLVASVMVWAIAIEKLFLYSRTRRARDSFAQALFATAIGLIAAIPATIFYNKFVSDVNKQVQRLQGFADEFSAILSRQIDERG